MLKHDVAAAQVAQAQAALNTTRAQAAQVARAPLRSDVEAATAHVGQARAPMDQQRAAVAQAEHAVAQARAQYNQFEAARDLAVRQYEHSTKLAVRGFIAQTAFDQAHANRRIAEAQLQAQHQALAVAQAAVTAAQAGVAAAQANVHAQEAHLRTVQTGARPEDMQVAQQRVEEAEQTLQVVRQHAANAIVTAPLAGMVVALHAEVGQTVGTQGVLKLVSGTAEIRLEVDESYLADLSVGQAVTLSSSTFGDRPFQGTVSAIAAAVDTATLDEDELARLRSEEIGFIFQFHHLLDELTCLENALLPIIIRHGVATEAQRVRVIRLLQHVGLGPHLHKRPDAMSGGQNQRCAVVRALAHAPQIVLADEPTGNLDSRSGAEVFALMREMNRDSGVAFVMITHDDRLAHMADRILVIEDGLLQESTCHRMAW